LGRNSDNWWQTGRVTDGSLPVAFGQLSIGSVADWRRAGLSNGRLRTLVAAGQLVQLRRGAYATSGILANAGSDPGLRHGLDVAAVRATRGSNLVASHESAATLRGLRLLKPAPEGTVTLTIPPGTRKGSYRRTGVICHTADLPKAHVTGLYGIPLTTAGRTVIDIARKSSFMEGIVVADSALYDRYTSKTELRRVLASCARWPGIAQASEVVDFASGLAESAFESCARVVFRDQQLPAPELQVPILGQDGTHIARVDFLWRRLRVIAEADGLLKYDSGQKAIAERQRDRLLHEAGYEIVHFTWKELFADPARVARRIRDAFARQRRLSHGN
jgi:very-short-patch-repair endonuclease